MNQKESLHNRLPLWAKILILILALGIAYIAVTQFKLYNDRVDMQQHYQQQ